MPLRWYFISVVLRFKPSATKARKAFRQRQPVEENWEIHRAISLAAASAKAKKAAKVACATPMTNLKTGEKGLWTFVGIKECWLIYDDLADGCEIAWFQHGRMTDNQLRRLMCNKPKSSKRDGRNARLG